MTGRVRAPAATTEEVFEAVLACHEKREDPVRLVTSAEVVGVVAHTRGCPDTWPSMAQARQYVSVNSVKAQLEVLVAEGKLWAFKGTHHAVSGLYGRSDRHTYYVDDSARQRLLERAVAAHASTVLAAAQAHAANTLVRKYNAEYLQYLEDYSRLYPIPDWDKQW